MICERLHPNTAFPQFLRTHRIVLICLNAQADRINATRTLVEAQADWDESTLGEIAGAQWVFVVNSQGNQFDEQHRFPASVQLIAPRIARLDLPPSGCTLPP